MSCVSVTQPLLCSDDRMHMTNDICPEEGREAINVEQLGPMSSVAIP